ncbi:hypothetical protein [Salmonella sp. SJTUF14076]|nr:hypothetical protein [Salmonella sp. SJTUF14076]
MWDCFNLWADIGNEKDRPGDYSLSGTVANSRW